MNNREVRTLWSQAAKASIGEDHTDFLVRFANLIENTTLERAALLVDASANEACDTYGSAYLVGAAKDIRGMKT